jgi:hypothetical protein
MGDKQPRKEKEHTAITPVLSNASDNEHVCKNGGIAPPFLTLALDGGDSSASRPSSSTPGGKGPIPVVLMLDGPPEPVWTLQRQENLISLLGITP